MIELRSDDERWIYNFAPTGDLRKQLGLIERIQEKIQGIATTFGHAAPILDSAEEQVHKTRITSERLEEVGSKGSYGQSIGGDVDMDTTRRLHHKLTEEIELIDLPRRESYSVSVLSVIARSDGEVNPVRGVNPRDETPDFYPRRRARA